MISVITCCYNDPVGLKKTRASIKSQIGADVEHIIIDGGNCGIDPNEPLWAGAIIKRFEPKGISNALNRGLELATGEFLLFLNAGDSLITSQSLLNLITMIPPNWKFDVYYSNWIYERYGYKKTIIAEHRTLAKENRICHQALLYNSETAKRFIYDERLPVGMDYDVHLRMLTAGCKWKKLDCVFSTFQHNGASSARKFLVRAAIYGYIIRVVNKFEKPTVGTLIRCLKHCIKQLISDHLFALPLFHPVLKRKGWEICR